jgi:hypothetical protein
MQPDSNSDNLHDILSRFTHWAGDRTGKTRPHAGEPDDSAICVREIPYEEALRRLRSQQGMGGVAQSPLVTQPPHTEEPIAEDLPGEPPVFVPQPPPVTPMETMADSEEVSCPTAEEASAAAVPQMQLAPPHAAAPTDLTLPAVFRDALEKSVRAAKPAGKLAGTKKEGRDRHISVRFTRAEDERLQAGAAHAGMTVSEYLRMCALEWNPSPPPSRSDAAPGVPGARRSTSSAWQPPRHPKRGVRSWITLLRNRFLVPQAPFREQR